MEKICNICFEPCNFPATNNLNCECKYFVHFKCILKWYNLKGTCMICNEPCFKPTFSFYRELNDKQRDSIDVYNNNYRNNYQHFITNQLMINNQPVQLENYTPAERFYQNYTEFIVNRLDNLPFDNENEAKTIFFAGIFFCIIYVSFIFYA